ncbi:MAG: hypothetical protein H6752_07195 [Candidatus Omnitrophica bacterium]|nr:hypothetical protein [Candidatus Omnitrophota bacterium]
MRIGAAAKCALAALFIFAPGEDIPFFGGGHEETAWCQGFGAGRDESVFRSRRSRDSRRSTRYEDDYNQPPPPPDYQNQQQAPSQQEQEPQEPPAPAPRPQQPPAAVPQPGVPGVRRALPPGAKPLPPGQTPPGQGKEGEAAVGVPLQGDLVLRLAPLQQKVAVDEIVPVHVWLDNPLEKEFNVLSFALSYDPDVLEFIDAPGGTAGVHSSYDLSEKTLESFDFVRDRGEDLFYLNRADTENGMIYYRARSASGETETGQGFVLSMKFRVLSPTDRSPIQFLFAEWPEVLAPPIQSDQEWTWPEEMTYVGLLESEEGGPMVFRNVLGDSTDSKDGVISGGVTVQALDKEEMIERKTTVPEGELKTLIVLDPPAAAVEEGKEFDLNVRVVNPEQVPWDQIRLDIRFDPRFLEVVDQDEGNWVSIGTNILDGPYHTRFPFDWMRQNLVRQDEGRILYENGVFRQAFEKEGTIATIRFKGLKTTAETPVYFHMDPSPASKSGTRLSYRRSDVLGDTEFPRDGTIGSTVSIVPRRDYLSADIDPVR